MTMQMVREQTSTITPHPNGHAGILASLKAVAKKVQEGRKHPDVISWAGHALVRQGSPSGNLSRAAALYEEMGKQYAYMHDPRGIERMVGAHLTLGDGKDKAPRFPGGDCDDAVIAYLSACEAAGIPTAIVGASYDPDGTISHVLGLVSDGQGKWMYADRSAKGYKFGQAKRATREIILDTLTSEILCDDTICSNRLQGKLPPEEPGGGFHSIDSEHVVALGEELGHLAASGDVSALGPGEIDYIKSKIDSLQSAFEGLNLWWTKGITIAESIGIPIPGDAANPIAGPDAYQRAVDLKEMLSISITSLQEVLSGARKIGISEGGLFGADLIVERLPTDKLYVGFDLKERLPKLYLVNGDVPTHSGGTLGFGPAAAIAVVSIAIALAVAADAWASAEKAKASAELGILNKEAELIKAGKDAELVKVRQARASVVEAENKGKVGSQIATALDSGTKFLATVGGLSLVFVGLWGIKKAADKYGAKR